MRLAGAVAGTLVVLSAVAVATPRAAAAGDVPAPRPIRPPVAAGDCTLRGAVPRVVTLPSGVTIPCAGPAPTANSAAQQGAPCAVASVRDWCPDWTSTYNQSGEQNDTAGYENSTKVIGTSGDGRYVFVAATSNASTLSSQEVTLAFDQVTGALVWQTPYVAPTGGRSYAQALAVAGSRVLVSVLVVSGSTVYAENVALDVASGQVLWSTPLSLALTEAVASAASSDGSALFVTGAGVVTTAGGGHELDAVTIAYDATTGATLWTRTVSADGEAYAEGFGIAMTAGKVYIAVAHAAQNTYLLTSVGLEVYNATSGGVVASGVEPLQHADDQDGLAVTPDGSHASVEFQDLPVDASGTEHVAMGVVGFDGASGAPLWKQDYLGPNATAPIAQLQSGMVPWCWQPIVASPDGSTVYAVTESNDGDYGTAGTGFTVVAYRAADGAQLWAADEKKDTPTVSGIPPIGQVLAVDSAGRALYVTGADALDQTFATLALDPATGATIKTAVYTGGAGLANAMALSPDGTRLFVAGVSVSSVNTSTQSLNQQLVAIEYSTDLTPAASTPEVPWAPGLMIAAGAVAYMVRRRSQRSS